MESEITHHLPNYMLGKEKMKQAERRRLYAMEKDRMPQEQPQD